LIFKAGLRDGNTVAESRGKRSVAHPGFAPEGRPDGDNIRVDVGLIEIETPIPAARAAPYPVARLNASEKTVSVLSYAAGRADALSWQPECRVMGRKAALLAFDCDTDFGSSGAPVMLRGAGRAQIVALISAKGRGADGKELSFGMELPGVVDMLRDALRSGRGVISAAGAVEPAAVTNVGPSATKRASGARFLKP
jgi:protease YdgD